MRVGAAQARARSGELLDPAIREETVEVARRGEVVAVIGPGRRAGRAAAGPPRRR